MPSIIPQPIPNSAKYVFKSFSMIFHFIIVYFLKIFWPESGQDISIIEVVIDELRSVVRFSALKIYIENS